MDEPVMISEEMLYMQQIVLPVVVLALLTLLVNAVMFIWRVTGSLTGKLPGEYYTLYRGENPASEGLARIERHYHNLLEGPVLFYATIPLILWLVVMDAMFVTLAWWYVGMRIVHTLVHIFINNPLLRFLPWLGSFIVLCIMWIKLLLLAI